MPKRDIRGITTRDLPTLEVFKIGDLVLLENQRNKNRKGGKRDVKYSGPYTIMEISDERNCTLKHESSGIANRRYPFVMVVIFVSCQGAQ